MLCRWAIAGLALFLPTLALAQQVTIRGGEHQTHTRLVLSSSSAFQWSQRRPNAATVELQLSDTAEFNLSEAFDRIDRARIADVTSPSPGLLKITLACDCDVQAETIRAGLVAVDIGGQRQSQVVVPQIRPVARPLPNLVKSTQLPVVFQRSQQKEAADLVRALPLELDDPFARSSESIGLFEDQLQKQLSQAVAQGLLVPNAPNVVKSERPKTDDPVAPDDAIQNTHSPLSECLPSEKLAIGEWGTESRFVDQLADLRHRLALHADGGQQKLLEQLAQLYLYFGFGAEARLISETADLEQRQLYGAMAAVLDEIPETATAFFRAQTGCETDAALWGVLAQPDDAEIDFLSERAILSAFDHLPDHLRRHVAPHLVRKLSLWGFTPTSKAILSRLARMGGEMPAALQLAIATVLEAQNESVEAQEILKDLSRNNGQMSSIALQTLLDGGYEANREEDADLIDLAQAYATEHRSTPLETDAQIADLRAALRADEFDRALDGLNSMSAPPRDLLDEALLRLAKRADAARFLKYSLGWTSLDTPQPGLQPALVAADRLLDLGFARIAIDLLGRVAPDPNNRSLRLLTAKALLMDGDAEKAEISLIGLTGEEVETLRAKIRSEMGDYAYAAQMSTEGESAGRNAFLAEDWDRLAQEKMTDFQGFAEWLAGASDERSDLSLENAQSLIDESENARTVFNALLDRTRVDW